MSDTHRFSITEITHKGHPFVVVEVSRSERTGLDAIFATDTMFGFEGHASSLSFYQGIRRTDPGTGRIKTRPADNHHKTFTNPAGRADVDTRAF